VRDFELDKWDLKRMCELWKKGRVNLQPEYQRSNVWDDGRRYDLVDTVLRNWPMGLVMLRAYPVEDASNHVLESYDVVDGQQRLTTLFNYLDGSAEWAAKIPAKRHRDFKPYKELTVAVQSRVDEYKVAVALMREYEVGEIQDVYSRLQSGKPLKIGERIKALRSGFREYVKELSAHKLFKLDQHTNRDSNWNLAAQFFKAAYTDDAFARVEFLELKGFLTESPVAASKAQKARDRVQKVMTFERKVIDETVEAEPEFDENVSSARMLKWTFAALMQMLDYYSVTGKEHLVAKGLLAYYEAKGRENSIEWTCYLRSGRTGRMDTGDVKVCVNQLFGYLLDSSKAEPLDPSRWFSAKQREEIWGKSGGVCQECGLELSKSNFHADHIKPHSESGATTVENGQALCSSCNLKKGKDVPFRTQKG
jgi:hypothetical protein